MGKASRRKKVTGPIKPALPVIPHVARPFAGLPAERELVAMREILPAATLKAKLTKEYGEKEITFVTVLPDAATAMIRADGEILIALQTRSRTGDNSHDLGVAIVAALDHAKLVEAGEAEPAVIAVDVRVAGPRLDEIVAEYDKLELKGDLGFWLAPGSAKAAEAKAAIEESATELIPTKAIPGTNHTYWHDMTKIFVRWIRDEDETELLTALARLGAADKLTLGRNSRCIGAFRAAGLSIPVFEFPEKVDAEELTDAVQTLEKELEKALQTTEPLSETERRVRAGLVSRQVSLR
ncbi:DUF5926 family protein [Gleimia sp. 6138-11-ORH1]|uniref:DUF5926 family protein n=1 Tax=Gleimia sp. 6138-11-ORH1 TaxID=2973937 RepID=UPI002168EA1F|nr:DUF5926 family protein [Gleimia sp. 6138-11-ORH1]MCS4485086.1 DUF5926 family protein [Gleimia sp. 6138-11-ORH1]